MRIDVQKLRRNPESPLQIQGDLPIDFSAFSSDFASDTMAHVDAVAHWADDGVLVEGKCATEVTVVCARCLVPVRMPLQTGLYEYFSGSTAQAPPIQQEKQLEWRPLDGDWIDLAPILAEVLWTELPFAPVCRTDCRGLCSVCGTNRNKESCTCDNGPFDSRWSKLQELLPD